MLGAGGGFGGNLALLIAAGSRLAPAAGNTSQPKKAVATNQRTIRQPSAKCLTTIDIGLASSSPTNRRRERLAVLGDRDYCFFSTSTAESPASRPAFFHR